MMVEVEVHSRETIQPSSPTPPHSRKFDLSGLDQLIPPVYTSVIFYYTMNNFRLGGRDNGEEISSKLRESLSETLSQFYPLAGRIRANLYIECNDEGALYSEARVNCRLEEFLSAPDLEALDGFLPFHTICTVPEEEAVQVAVQVNVFSCGGIAIGVSLLHKLIDGVLMGAFVKRWASICRGTFNGENTSHPYTELASLLFPPSSALPPNASNWLLFPSDPKSCAGRYVFGPSSLSKLRAQAASEAVPNPTAIEALSAFIWRRAMSAEMARLGASKLSSISHAVDMRSRMEPRLPEHSIGNIFWKAYAHVDGAESVPEARLVELLRKSFSDINSHYVARLQGDGGHSAIAKWLDEVGELYAKCAPNHFSFSDWCKLGLYGADFGWGLPVWVSTGCIATAPYRNGAYFMESSQKGGVEVWLILDEEDKRTLEHDQEFLALASINPSVAT